MIMKCDVITRSTVATRRVSKVEVDHAASKCGRPKAPGSRANTAVIDNVDIYSI